MFGLNEIRGLRVAASVAAILCAAALPAAAQNEVNFEEGQNGAENGGQINISGATLFADFFKFPASTNDWINVDGDLIDCSGQPKAGFYDGDCDGNPDNVDQLSPFFTCPEMTTYWLVQYRSVGSVEGFGEFVDWHVGQKLPFSVPSEIGLINRRVWAMSGNKVAGCVQADCNTNGTTDDDSGTPVCPNGIDLSSTDVPSGWVVVKGGTDLNDDGYIDESELEDGAIEQIYWGRKPTELGYGLGLRQSTSGFVNQLESLVRDTNTNGMIDDGDDRLNTDIADPDDRTIFDTVIAWSPVVPIANRGTGLMNIRYTQLQHLLVTGRLPSGENMQAATRDIGSGTRNDYNNGLGVDPSHANGDNVGDRINTTTLSNLGPNTQPTNCGGSSIMENSVQQRRLAIGYTGLAGPSRAAADANSGLYEILNVCKDFDGDGDGFIDSDCESNDCDETELVGCGEDPFTGALVPDDVGASNSGFVRPTITTTLDNLNPVCGYQIAAGQTIGSVGDPLSGLDGNTNPPMSNLNARDYLRNLIQSISDFNGDVNDDSNFNMPGQLAALSFFTTAAVDAITYVDPVTGVPNPTHLVANPTLNQVLQDYARCFNGLGIGSDTPDFGAESVAGRVPKRNALPAGVFYSDGSNNGNYRDSNGNYVITSSLSVTLRNRIAGDFDVDGARNIDDTAKLVEAWSDPLAFEQADAVNFPGDYIIPEIIGDFDGDGNFDVKDLRYFGDGLGVDPISGELNRRAAFIEIDEQLQIFAESFPPAGWATTLATGKDYENGDIVFDVAGNPASPGAHPTGYDGVVNAADIDYIYANFGEWTNLDVAASMDLSADMTGDLIVDQSDVDEIVITGLCTTYGDADLDADVDQTDVDIVTANQGGTGGWALGDFDGDGDIDADDLATANGNIGFISPCFAVPGDIDGDGDVDGDDVTLFANVLLGTETNPIYVNRSDLNGDGAADGEDIQVFVNAITE